jgi:DNA-binding response OmpR family regulator
MMPRSAAVRVIRQYPSVKQMRGPRHQSSVSPDQTPRHITIVDDDRDARELLEIGLGQRGYHVTVVSNGLRLFAALQIDKPELLILDVNMSWIDGFELCRGLKRNPAYHSIPVLFLSGRTAPSDIERGLACGAAGYLTKPIHLADLVAKVESIIGATPR